MDPRETNDIFIAPNEWELRFKGWHIVDIVVRNKNRVTVLSRQTLSHEETSEMFDHDIESRAIQLQLDRPSDQERAYRAGHVEGFNRPVLGTCALPVHQEFIVAKNTKGSVFASGSGQRGMEYISPEDKVPMTQRIVTIGGWAYSVGGVRKIYKRTAVGQWEQFDTTGLPDSSAQYTPKGKYIDRAYMGFRDMDGPSEDLLYAVGGHGEVFLYQDRHWRQCDFPSNEQLGTVTVAPDGTVYITGEGGNLWQGQEDTWELLERGGASVLYNDSRWFDGQLWLASDYYVRVLQGDRLQRPSLNGEELHFFGHMDARDGLLVIASPATVHAFDGTHWRCLVAPYK